MIYLIIKFLINTILITQCFLIFDSIQQIDYGLQRLYRLRNGSNYFYFQNDLASENSYRLGDNNKHSELKYMSSLNKSKPVLRSKLKNGLSRTFTPLQRPKRSARRYSNLMEQPIDPETESDELEFDSNIFVNYRTLLYSPIKDITIKNCGNSKSLKKRIVNGMDAEEGAYPWIVAVLKYGDGWCGGTILNEWWIITASHCFMSLMDIKAYVVRVGSVDRNIGTTYKITKLLMHERFHFDNQFNSDIALLKVNRPIKMSELVTGVCLPEVPFEEPKTTTMIVVGWGATKFQSKELPFMLQEVTLNRISDGECAKKYQEKSNTIYKSQLCSWTENKDACQGDSGGPAIELQNSRAVLIGIVSYGSKCADKFPGVYTQVSYFLQWIKDQIDEDKEETVKH